jgi:arylsulfatase A-like enzyme
MSNNEYAWRTWHLPEDLHVTSWTTTTAARTIKRRDPQRPALWHVSYTHPHPPIVPLASYFDRYRDKSIEVPPVGRWASDVRALPYALRAVRHFWPRLKPAQHADMLRAFYAQCTHIDHQLRLLIGTLREEEILDNTVILVTGDHGDMLGTNGLYAKRLMYEGSVGIPMILVGTSTDRSLVGRVDDRLVGLQDVMPTLLDMCGIPVPATCEGRSMVSGKRREILYCESLVGRKATRMVHDGHHKLIWYPAGNLVQIFDVVADPNEQNDLAHDPDSVAIRKRLTAALISELYGEDRQWAIGDTLIGMPDAPDDAPPNRGLSGQRGVHFPPLAPTDPNKVVGAG